jgi:hypothetical protein
MSTKANNNVKLFKDVRYTDSQRAGLKRASVPAAGLPDIYNGLQAMGKNFENMSTNIDSVLYMLRGTMVVASVAAVIFGYVIVSNK